MGSENMQMVSLATVPSCLRVEVQVERPEYLRRVDPWCSGVQLVVPGTTLKEPAQRMDPGSSGPALDTLPQKPYPVPCLGRYEPPNQFRQGLTCGIDFQIGPSLFFLPLPAGGRSCQAWAAHFPLRS